MKKIFTLALMTAVTISMFTSCESSDQYEADLLVSGDWQGYLDTYYHDRWGLTGNTYETVMHFSSSGVGATSGLGYEVDYDTRSPFNDYAYCQFRWMVVDGVITIIYDDSMWSPVYITRYSLSDNYFSGIMDDGTNRRITFKLRNIRFEYWNRYSDSYYYSRRALPDSLSHIESQPYENNGKSICSGAFVMKQ